MRLLTMTLFLLLASGSSLGMTMPTANSGPCRVTGGAKLLAASGGAGALCSAIERAAKKRAPAAKFTVDVRVRSPASMTAVVRLADGRLLPEQTMAVSDAAIGRSAVERFARAIAEQVHGAGHR